MILYFIRHTTPDIEKGICYGQSDLEVSESFEDESDFLLNKLQYVDIDTVVSSPLQRCTQLARKINPNFTVNKTIKELNFGNWELVPWNEIPKHEIDPWMEDFVHVKVPNGESYTDLYLRSVAFYKQLSQNNTIVVTHSGVLRSVLAYITQTDLTDSFSFKLPYGTIVKIDTETNQYQIL